MPFIPTDDARWDAMLRTAPYDFYHLPEYAQLDAGVLGGQAMGWVPEYGYPFCLIPLIGRYIHPHGQDLISPYGYPGILSREPLTSEDVIRILQSYHREALAAGYVSSFIRLNPMLNDWVIPETDLVGQKCQGSTVSIDLTRELEVVTADFSENHRRDILKLIRNGFTAQVNQQAYLPDFITAYYETMKRCKALNYYFFSKDYFNSLESLKGTQLLFISISDRLGKFVAGGIFMLTGKVMQFHLGATYDDSVLLSPSKLMIMEAINQGMLMGATTLHLGGGTGTNAMNGLLRFKKGFFPHTHPFKTLHLIHKKSEYQELAYNRVPTGFEDYFPAYRANEVV